MSNIVDDIESIRVEKDSLKKKLKELELVNVQKAAQVIILEKKIKKLKTIILISCVLFVVFLLGRMK